MIRVAVRTLCEFAARAGDLDHRYTPSPTSDEGREGHARVQARRGQGYEAELMLSGQCQGLSLKGRADGYHPVHNRLEEIKTHRGDLSRLSEAQKNLHWAQLRCYGALLCQQKGLPSVELALVYYDIGRDRETVTTECATADDLQQGLVALCDIYRAWAEQEAGHRTARDGSLADLRFPFADFRAGQRPLAEAVYKAVCRNRTLMLQAPTGLGKTLGTLFPALMAMPRQSLDRLFFLTARTTGRKLALDGLTLLAEGQQETLPLRVLELVAKSHACENPELACHGESCPLARGFFDRLPMAREEAVRNQGWLDQGRLRAIALNHGICPYYLGQEMARWSDLVIGDVNHYFDQSALLHALTRQNDWHVTLLIDEAHNLITRGRAMYSIELRQQRLLAVKRRAPAQLKAPLERVARQWQTLLKDPDLPAPDAPDTTTAINLTTAPQELTGALAGLVTAITEFLTDNPADAELQELMFEALGYNRLAEQFGDHSVCALSRQGRGRAVLSICNLIPADFLKPRFESARSALLFSATLTPPVYHRDLLGLPDTTGWQEVASPFASRQLRVSIPTGISTRFHDRSASLEPIGQLLVHHFRARPGNYLAYFSSFAYLNAVHDVFMRLAPDIVTWPQSPGMSQDERQRFIAHFRPGGQGIGFAVLGGVFAEGIDLPGDRLIGAFVATLGLPPFNERNETLRRRLQARFGSGYEYTYLYPGIEKVTQAAGRVIRTPSDTGEIVLIDDRFRQPDVQSLLPQWWFPVAD
ncbi:ATP-dependent DNA helicase [Marinobacter salicampi]|uniref:ATP-dependent DNA helicase n=1 Tax=Marinobacter salicampi TaxID=435907 RepID=UPI001F5FC86A|nr:ATP-dependent DNA helicase [Marinobacter salicampi]